MKSSFALIALASLLPFSTYAQGVSAAWDVSQSAAALAAQAEKLTPVLQQLTPQQWESKGAPSAYSAQLQSARNEIGYLTNVARSLAKQPEKLTLALETYFRLQAVETQVSSLVEGTRKYQNAAVGDLLFSVLAANFANRDQLRQYITDLADTKEQEFKVVDQEAQRCRGTLTRQPAARPATTAPKPATPPAK
jgi:hypothetical protein